MASTFPPPQPLPALARLRRGLSLRNDRNGVESRHHPLPESGTGNFRGGTILEAQAQRQVMG
jgi:hypothetical protein